MMRIVIPLEMQDMKGGMLQSVELLVRYLPPEVDKIVVIPREAHTGERMEAAGARVVSSSLGNWTIAKASPARTARTLWTVRREIRPLLDSTTALMTNNLGVEVLCGLGEPFRGTPRVFVNRGGGYGGVSGLALRHSVASASACVATTDYQRRVLANQLRVDEARIRVIPNGVDIAGLEAAAPGRPRWYRQGIIHIGVLGYPSENKNQELLVRSVGLLRARGLPVAGVIAGSAGCHSDERYLARLRAVVKTLRLEEHVIFVPFMEDKAALFSGIDMLACTSFSEGFGRTLIEAMAAGRPVVAVRAGGPECVIEHGVSGLLVPSHDPAELASALASLIADAALRERLVAHGRQVCRSRYDARGVAARYGELFRELTSPSFRQAAA